MSEDGRIHQTITTDDGLAASQTKLLGQVFKAGQNGKEIIAAD